MSTLIDSISKTYDEVPYVSAAFLRSAPEHLRAVAHLFGLDAPAPAHARVLELGCAAGGNLVPFAVRHPQAEVVGIDLSPVQIDAGRRLVETMGLTNVRLVQGSLTGLDESIGKFDYIVCHGVYSWVPDEVRAAILDVCRRFLTPDGVAYISYNTYPGWKAKEIVRDAMLLRGGGRANAQEQLAYARGMVEFLHEQASPGSVLATVMNEHIDVVRNGEDFYLSHEYLELCNAPCYFRDFVGAARGQGLEYLGDATVASMFARNYGAAAPALLAECGGDQVVLEQLMDFLQNRTFRQSLLVHGDRAGQISYRLDAERVARLHVGGHFTPGPAQDGEGENWTYSDGGATFTTRSPVARAAIQRLTDAWPATVPLADLLAPLSTDDGVRVMELVTDLIIGNALRFRVEPVVPGQLAGAPFARPELRALASTGIQSMALFNEWHEPAQLDGLRRFLLPLLDGNVDVDTLVGEVLQRVAQGEMTVTREGQPIEDADERAASVRNQVDTALRSMVLNSVIVPAPEAVTVREEKRVARPAEKNAGKDVAGKPAKPAAKAKQPKVEAPAAKPAKAPRGKK